MYKEELIKQLKKKYTPLWTLPSEDKDLVKGTIEMNTKGVLLYLKKRDKK